MTEKARRRESKSDWLRLRWTYSPHKPTIDSDSIFKTKNSRVKIYKNSKGLTEQFYHNKKPLSRNRRNSQPNPSLFNPSQISQTIHSTPSSSHLQQVLGGVDAPWRLELQALEIAKHLHPIKPSPYRSPINRSQSGQMDRRQPDSGEREAVGEIAEAETKQRQSTSREPMGKRGDISDGVVRVRQSSVLSK